MVIELEPEVIEANRAIASIRARDPLADPRVKIINAKYDALKNVGALVVLTEWPEYWSPEFELMLQQMSSPVIIDGRNIYDRGQIEALGFTYYGIGK